MISFRQLQDLSRADFLRSVGLYVMREHLVLVRMRKDLFRVSVVEQQHRELPEGETIQPVADLTEWIAEGVREVALKAEAESRQRALRDAVHSLLPHFSPGQDAVYICVPQDQAIVQEIFLPQAAEENLAQVLEYEIERQVPFRRDDIYYDFLPAGKTGDKIKVFLFAIPKRSLAGLLEALASFGVTVEGIETTSSAVANYMLFSAGELNGPAVVVGGQGYSWEAIGLDEKRSGWRQEPQLVFSQWLPQAEWVEGSGREMLRQCLSHSQKLFGWGNVGDFLVSPDGKPLRYQDLVSLGNERLEGGQAITHPYFLPALGAALRGLREASLTINLLRREGRDERRSRVLSRVNAALTVLLLLGAVAWGASYSLKDEIRLRRLQKENQKIDPAVQAVRREEAELERLRKQMGYIADLQDRRGEVLRVLDELSRIVPPSAYLSNLRYRNGVLELQGSADSASNLVPLLERSPLLENVTFNAPSNRGRDSRETFSLKAEIERPKKGASKP